ncbi:unnamed protein product [Pieris brassicae]|uniref:Uncharacterized protein n=1 Tax=Pieris brassicae TaxID=7116 RepID=A0A9P0XG52_PIEBR|nr:unnamed protein product [Pieris brassicae]
MSSVLATMARTARLADPTARGGMPAGPPSARPAKPPPPHPPHPTAIYLTNRPRYHAGLHLETPFTLRHHNIEYLL